MTSKEFVKQHYPRAYCTKVKPMRGDPYFLIRPAFNEMYIGIGNTQSNAWVNAKANIEKQDKS